MQRINTTHSVDNSFVDEDLQHGIYPTEFSASFMNALQEELCGILERFGIELDENDNNQLADLLENPLRGIFDNVKLSSTGGTTELNPGSVETRSSSGTSTTTPGQTVYNGPTGSSSSTTIAHGGITMSSRGGVTTISSSRVQAPNVESPNIEAEYIGKRTDTVDESFEDLAMSSDLNGNGQNIYGLAKLVASNIGNNNGNTQMNGSFVFGASGLCQNFLTYAQRNNLVNLPVVGGTRVTFVNVEVDAENFEVKFYTKTGTDSYAVLRHVFVPYNSSVEIICIGQYNDSNGVPRRIWVPYGIVPEDIS